jgi:hypothetical protein
MDTTTTTIRSARLHLQPEVAETIRACSFDGLKALPRRGAEIGGFILAGSATPPAGEEIRLVPAEYLYGPSYHLSARDLPELRAAKTQCEADGKKVVAYFRSCTRPVMRVEPEDRDAIAFACPDVPFVVLAKPAMSGSTRILVFGRDGGDWIPGEEWEIAPPFRAVVPPATAPARAPAPVSKESAAPPPRAPQTALPHPPTAPRRPLDPRLLRDPRLLYAGGGVLLLLCIGVAVRFQGRSVTPPAPSAAVPVADTRATSSNDPKLDLEVRDEKGRMHLSWNRNSESARSAVSGEVQITDSDTVHSIQLHREDITGGSVVYTPRASDVTFRLLMRDREGKAVAEMIRVVGNGPSIQKVPPAVQPAAPKQLASAHPPAATPAPTIPAPKTTAPVVPAPTAEHPDTTSPIEIRREAPQPVQQSSPTVPAAEQRTPEPQASAPAPVAATAPPVSQPPVELPRPSPPVQTTATTAAPAPNPKPVVPQRQEIVTVPPVPVHQVMPSKKSGLPWNVYAPVTVGVLVTVDAKGKVSKVRADSNIKGGNPFLLAMSLSAARDWTFKPATQGGKPVPGEYRIEFLFQPDQHAR